MKQIVFYAMDQEFFSITPNTMVTMADVYAQAIVFQIINLSVKNATIHVIVALEINKIV
jgi:hypothetical protein